VTVRRFHSYDAAAVARVFREAVLITAAAAYTPEQLRVWAQAADDEAALAQRLTQGTTLVAEDNDGIVAAFGQREPAGHIAYLYCAPRFGRRGVASLLLRRLEATAAEAAIPQLTTDASHVARPFFTRHGFTEVRSERVTRDGVELERFHLVKVLR
jgi:putative acetyltransferase